MEYNMLNLTKSTDTKYDADYKGHKITVIKLIKHWSVAITKNTIHTYINLDFNTKTEAFDFLNTNIDSVYKSNTMVIDGEKNSLR